MDSYLPTFLLTALYLLSIWLGNKYMKNRKALSLRGTLTLYNLGITLLSGYMLVEVRVHVAKSGAHSDRLLKATEPGCQSCLGLSPHCSLRLQEPVPAVDGMPPESPGGLCC